MTRSLIVSWLLAATLTPFVSAQDKKIPITGRVDADLAPFDEMMLKFLADNQVPGAALAVARDGKLVYARGFGHADQQLGIPVEPRMRFRIASISKPITAVTILRLIELGLLRMNDNPFDVLQIMLPADFDPRLRKITIRHLLQHTAGWDRDRSFDPMFRPNLVAKERSVKPPPQPRDIILYMTHRKLDFDPGERFAYSNFGYCILGRVMEKVTGQSYESAVQKHVFDPIGVKDTQLGQTLTAAKNEVHYFDEKNRKGKAVLGPNFGKLVPRPYGAWHLESLDAHGGWISTAPDLVRFASAFDHPKKCKLLKASSIQTMFARPDGLAGHDMKGNPLDVFYGCGWNVRTLTPDPSPKGRREYPDSEINTWHMGALDGTASVLVRRSDGLTWAVLFNTCNNRKGEYLGELIDPLVHEAADKVKRWPTRDLFER